MDSRVRKAIDLLKAHPAWKFNISELAHAVNLSPWHLSHLVLKNTRISPREFVRQLWLERARVLLEGSLLSVKEIMVVVGINDKSHFAKAFKKAYGLPPTQYRHKCSGSSDEKSSRSNQQTAQPANN